MLGYKETEDFLDLVLESTISSTEDACKVSSEETSISLREVARYFQLKERVLLHNLRKGYSLGGTLRMLKPFTYSAQYVVNGVDYGSFEAVLFKYGPEVSSRFCKLPLIILYRRLGVGMRVGMREVFFLDGIVFHSVKSLSKYCCVDPVKIRVGLENGLSLEEVVGKS